MAELGESGNLENLVEMLQAQSSQAVDRVMVFVDWAYVIRGVQEIPNHQLVDVGKLATTLTGRRRLIRTYFYEARIDQTPNDHWRAQKQSQQRLESALTRIPSLEIRWGRLQISTEGSRQKGVDVLLSLDMLRFALKDNYDRAILVSGDGDYSDIVRMVKDEGKTVEVAMFPSSTAQSLRQAADVLVNLDEELLKNCWLQ